jgi:hypothetical protein
MLIGILTQKQLYTLQPPSKPLAHSRALVACAAVSVASCSPMASPPSPASSAKPGAMRPGAMSFSPQRPPAPPIPGAAPVTPLGAAPVTPLGAAPPSPPASTSTLVGSAQAGVAAASALAGRGAGIVASALAGLRGTQRETFEAMNPALNAEDRIRDKKRDLEGKPKAPTLRPIQLIKQDLSKFPLAREPPSALAGAANVQVADDYGQTKGYASMMALLILMADKWQIVEASGCASTNLMKNLGWVIDMFSLRECVSWAFTSKGDIQGQNEKIRDFRLAISSRTLSTLTARLCPTRSRWLARWTFRGTSTCAF